MGTDRDGDEDVHFLFNSFPLTSGFLLKFCACISLQAGLWVALFSYIFPS